MRLGIEQANGIANIEKIEAALAAVKAADFILERNEGLADREDSAPWHWPLDGKFGYYNTLLGYLASFWITKIGQRGTAAGSWAFRVAGPSCRWHAEDRRCHGSRGGLPRRWW